MRIRGAVGPSLVASRDAESCVSHAPKTHGPMHIVSLQLPVVLFGAFTNEMPMVLACNRECITLSTRPHVNEQQETTRRRDKMMVTKTNGTIGPSLAPLNMPCKVRKTVVLSLISPLYSVVMWLHTKISVAHHATFVHARDTS